MQTRIMRSKKVSSTAPMTSRTAPVAYPSCSQVAVVSKSAASNACITPRKADGEHPTCVVRCSRAKNSLIVSRPTPRLRPNVLKRCTRSLAKPRSYEETIRCRFDPALEPMPAEATPLSPPCCVSTHRSRVVDPDGPTTFLDHREALFGIP